MLRPGLTRHVGAEHIKYGLQNTSDLSAAHHDKLRLVTLSRTRWRLLSARPGAVHQDQLASAAGQLIAAPLLDIRWDFVLLYPKEDALRSPPQCVQRRIGFE